jgi:hypothetical protein
MSIIVTYLAYLLISVGLTLLVGRVLSRSGRLFLLDVLGGSEAAARGISTLNVVTFYLISLGFVALTMPSAGASLTARHAVELLATKTGDVLLVLGALYLASIVVLTRLRRRLSMQAQRSTGAPSVGPEQATPPKPALPPTSAAPTWQSPPQAFWRPAPRKAAQ